MKARESGMPEEELWAGFVVAQDIVDLSPYHYGLWGRMTEDE